MQQLLQVLSTLNHVSGLMFSSCIESYCNFIIMHRILLDKLVWQTKALITAFAFDRMSQQFCCHSIFGWFCNKDKITNIWFFALKYIFFIAYLKRQSHFSDINVTDEIINDLKNCFSYLFTSCSMFKYVQTCTHTISYMYLKKKLS